MSVWSGAVRRARAWLATVPLVRAAFSASGPIDALIHGVWGDAWYSTAPVSRDDALTVAAVERGRDEICSVATLPLIVLRGLDRVPSLFLEQPDPDVPRVVTYAQTLEDLAFEGVAWWLKTSLDYRGFPLSCRRLDPRTVSLNPPAGETRSPAPLPGGLDPRGASVWVDGKEISASRVIRFDSPGRPLLTAAARDVRRAILIDALASRYADNPRPLEYFTDTDDPTVVPYKDPEVVAFLAKWRHERKRGGAAYIPKALTRMDVNAPSPAELQLVELKRQASLDLALHLGLDAEDVGVNTTSRTYFNATDRRTDKINRTLAPYMAAITDRLSMRDVTPYGQVVRFDPSEWLKPDATAQAAYWQIMEGMGAMSIAEIRAAAQLAGPPPKPKTMPAPAPAPALPAAAGENNRGPVILPAQLGPALTALRLSGQLSGQFNAGSGRGMTFRMHEFGPGTPAPTTDVQRRTITGLAVPYNMIARKMGVGFRFRPGALEYDAARLSRIRVKDDHQAYVGVHDNVTDTKAGPLVTLRILDGPEGSPTKMHRDQLLMDAAAGLADGLSVGVDFSLDPADGDVVWNEREQVYDVLRATWNETSVTPDPAFTGARVTRVVASRTGGNMQCQHCGHPHDAGISCQTYAQLAQQHAAAPAGFSAAAAPQQTIVGYQPIYGAAQQPLQQQLQAPVQQPVQQQFHQGPAAAAALPSGPVTTDQLSAALQSAVTDMVNAGQVAAAPPANPAGQFAQTVNPTGLPVPSPAQVAEPEPYRLSFNRSNGDQVISRGTHEFSCDMIAALKDGDIAARDRALSFAQKHLAAQFNVASTDVNETNPTKQRPDMWVDQRTYRYPLWSAINKGTLSDITPFTFPKFNSASSLVAAHTEGTEPTTGTFTTTGQTVTPTAYSGKARINREVWDQGGNPQTSTLIWNQMVKGVNEALEAAAVTELNAGSFSALATLTAGNADNAQTLSSQILAGLAALQFVRGGYAFTDAFAQADLYLALAAAQDDAGRPLFPMVGPSNANGTTTSRFGSIDLGGQLFHPEWALAAAGQTAATKSYLLDRSSVHGWASAPQRLVLDAIAVAYVDLGVWGYQATAVSDTTGVRTITWDPVA
jgi:hypothetical protein